MPAVTNPSESTVLVSGANGYIATWVVSDLLKKGYTVRAQVRAESKGQHLLKIYKDYADKGKLSLVIVPDFGKEGAFDEAVKGVDGVIHTASPVHLTAVEPKEIIDPAINGVLGMLKSVQKNGTGVKRVVVTSSCAAIKVSSPVPVDINETNWNDDPVHECETKGKDATPLDKYAASKTLAERAAWKFFEENKSSLPWDLSVINPPWVFGVPNNEVTTFDSMGDSIKAWYGAVVKGQFWGNPLTDPGHGWVDVRDAATAHVLALETPAAGGERIIVSAGPHVWQDWLDTANSLSPSPYPAAPLPKGQQGEKSRAINFDNSKALNILKIKFRTMEELTRDALEDFTRRGF